MPKAVKGRAECGLEAALVCRMMSPEPVKSNNLDARLGNSNHNFCQGVHVPRYRTVDRVLAALLAMEVMRVVDGMAVWAVRSVVLT